ncbi:hypothetical protein ACFLTA_08460 [Bacteroidota bacterium]
MEKTLTPEESLQIIQKSISISRQNLREHSFFYLFWGWVLIVASLTHYFVLEYFIRTEQYHKLGAASLILWGSFIGVGMLILFIYLSRNKKREWVETHVDRYMKYIWTTAGVLMCLLAFFSLKVGSNPPAFILAVTAMATAMSGLMLRLRILLMGSLVFVVSSVVAIFIQSPAQLLVVAAAMVLGYLVPGYILRYSKDRNNV